MLQDEVVEDGAAFKSGLVSPGDELIATSAVIFNNTKDYGGVSVKSGEEEIRLAVRGESFDTGGARRWVASSTTA